MKLRKVLKAFFCHKEKPVELDLSAAEIREGRAYLHPKNEAGVTYLVRSDNIEISLSKGFSLSPDHIIKMDPKEKKAPEREPKEKSHQKIKPVSRTVSGDRPGSNAADDEFDKYRKRKFVVSLYPDEYDSLMASMKEYGYKRADFVLACVNTATKGTMEREHRKIVKVHNELRKEEKALQNKRRVTDL